MFAETMAETRWSFRNEHPSQRAQVGIVTILASEAGKKSAALRTVVDLMIRHSGDWQKVMRSGFFRAVGYDERLIMVPLAIGQGLHNGGCATEEFRRCVDTVDPAAYGTPVNRMFAYYSGLMLGYLLHRTHRESEKSYTKGWLLDMGARQFPDLDEKDRAEALAHLDPFFEAPEEFLTFYAPGDDPVETAVLHAMVAVQTAAPPHPLAVSCPGSLVGTSEMFVWTSLPDDADPDD